MLKNLLIGLLIFILFFVAVDIAVRGYLYFKSNKSKKYLHFKVELDKPTPKELRILGERRAVDGYYKYSPGKYKFHSEGDDVSFNINRLGFRNIEFSAHKAENIKRICILGDSATFGVEVEDTQTCPFYINRILQAQRPLTYEVINCGFPCYNMEKIYNLFKKEVINYRPDLIIINSLCNDSFQPVYNIHTSLLLKVHNALYHKWMLYTVLLEKYSYIKYKHHAPFFYRPSYIAQDFAEYLKLIIALADRNNIKVVLIKEPMNLTDDIRENFSFSQLETMYSSTNDLDKRGRIAHCYYSKQLFNIARKNNILIIDPTKNFSDRADLFIDIVHLYPAGYKLLAEVIAKEILRHEQALFQEELVAINIK